MSAAPRSHMLYALLIGGLVSATGYAAAIAPPGGQGLQASDSNQKRDAAPGAANARRDAATWGGPLKGGDTASVPAGPRAPAARDRQQSGVVQDRRFAAPHRDFSPLRGATGNVAKPAIAAARHNLSRRSDVEHPLSRFDPAASVTRGYGATSSGATGRPSSTVLSAASRSVAGLKPLAAGNGVIGGPRAPGRGMIGGAVNGKSVLKASIDGTALRRRY
jgi:hypothetical protein